MGRIEPIAAAMAAAALLHAYIAARIFLWPLAALLLTSAALSALSPMAVNRRMTFLAHAQSHSILTASLSAAVTTALLKISWFSPYFTLVVIAYTIALNLLVLLVARSGFKEDVATGIVMSFQLAATIFLIYVLRSLVSTSLDPLALFTGEYLLITSSDVIQLAPVLAATSLFVALAGVPFLYIALDREYASSLGLRPTLYEVLFIIAMSSAAAVSVNVMGALIPAVVLVVPGAAAAKTTQSLVRQIPTASSYGVISASVSHFIYAELPWMWPNVAVALVLLAILLYSIRPLTR
ncbi:metal ABC transporter permease [Thermoproteus tenax]|uniref:ABC-type Mn/Zn transport system, permease protein n=2 Tax=Thermoproteus tenax TaxID=2271 RepID=G4RNL5_THETK|nr:metal ABC transporter permease [Thermoproteus tenax]CCC81159.1 ABC-type Mn/Zn transport system, permease protein [Thermoproteus tenax Kra 1]